MRKALFTRSHNALPKPLHLLSAGLLVLGAMTVRAQTPAIQWQQCVGVPPAILRTASATPLTAATSLPAPPAAWTGICRGWAISSNCLIQKIDAAGNILRRKVYGGSDMDWGQVVRPTSDSGYIVAGSGASADGDIMGHHGGIGSFDIWVLKLDRKGDLQWQRSYGGPADDLGYDHVVNDNGTFVAGYTASHMSGDVGANKGITDAWVLQLDSVGNIIWQQTLGGSLVDAGVALDRIPGGGYIVGGLSYSQDGDMVSGHYGSSLDRTAGPWRWTRTG